jgi:hypothetical protein
MINDLRRHSYQKSPFSLPSSESSVKPITAGRFRSALDTPFAWAFFFALHTADVAQLVEQLFRKQ